MRWHAGRVGQLGWVVAALGALAIAMPASAQAAAQWNSGAAQELTITDCVSIINGNPQSSPGVAVTPYVYEDYSNPPPATSTYYLAVWVYGIGDSCAGQVADIDMTLPANTTPSISFATPVVCHPLGPNAAGTQIVNGPADTSGACPQSPSSLGGNTYSFDMARNSGFDATSFYPFWAIPQGYGVEIDIPVTSSVAVTGQATAVVHMADGNSNPTLDPTVNVIVGAAGSQPSPTGDAESVIDPTVTNLTSTTATIAATFVYNYSNYGDPQMDYGNSAPNPNYTYGLGFGYSFNTAPYEVTASVPLTGLGAGCTYHWAGIMLNPSPQTTDGGTGDQTFTTPGSGGNCSAAPTQGSQGTPQIYKRAPVIPGSATTSSLKPVTPEINPPKKSTTPTPTPTPHTTPIVITTAAFTGVLLPAVQRGNLLKLQLTVGVADSRVEVDVFLPAVQRGKHRHKQELLGKLVKTRVAKGKLIMKIRLNSAGRRLLRQRRSLRLSLKLIVTPPGGKPTSVTKPVTLHP